MEEKLASTDDIQVNSFNIKPDGSVETTVAEAALGELKDQVSDEDMKKLQEEMTAEVERLEDKFTIVDAEIAENIEVSDITEAEARIFMEEDFDDLAAFAEIKEGLGLSASQLGIPKKYFVARDMKDEANDYKIYFNPKYFMNGSTRIKFKEGCLTYPGEFKDVKRWKNITLHWWAFDNKGKWTKYKKNMNGLNSIILQHECDHCSGYPGGSSHPRTIFSR